MVNIKIKKPTLEESLKLRLEKSYKLEKALGPGDKYKHEEFPDEELSRKNEDDIWKGYHSDVFHGLKPSENLINESAQSKSTATSHKRFVGRGNGKIYAIIKPRLDYETLKIPEGEDPRDNPDHSKAHSYFLHPNFTTPYREAAFHYLANNVFGLGSYVPRTSVFRHPTTNEPWSAQEFVPDSRKLDKENVPKDLKKYEGTDTLHKLAFMDSILGHNDRHSDNTMVTHDGDIKLVDNAGSFDYSHKIGMYSKIDAFHKLFSMPTYTKHILFSSVPEETHKWIQTLDPQKLSSSMIRARAPQEMIDKATERLRAAKEWSSNAQKNPHYSNDLAGALETIQSERFGENAGKIKQHVQNRIKNGELPNPRHLEDHEPTQIPKAVSSPQDDEPTQIPTNSSQSHT
jgi:hypothetical protein